MSCICYNGFSKTLNHFFYLAVIHFIVQFQITFSLAHQPMNGEKVGSRMGDRAPCRDGDKEAVTGTCADKDVKTVVMCDTELNFD